MSMTILCKIHLKVCKCKTYDYSLFVCIVVQDYCVVFVTLHASTSHESPVIFDKSYVKN